MKKITAYLAGLTLVSCGSVPPAYAHALTPQRLYVDSGAKEFIAQFTATNNYNFQDRFSVECFRGDVRHRQACLAIPGTLVMSPHATRKFKVKMEIQENDVYLVCTVEEPDPDEGRTLVTRVCSRVGVGVSPEFKPSSGKYPKRRPAADAMAAGAR